MKDNKGFTLSEVLIVIVIIGIILAISVPSIVAVRKRINERLLSGKIELILTEAERYGRDKGYQVDTIIYVYNLINNEYIEEEVSSTNSLCVGDNTSNGCIINPVDDSILNNEKILLKINGSRVKAIWDGNLESSESKELVNTVKEILNCEVVSESEPCVFTGTNPDNYLYYSGVMWRILGVYLIDGVEVVKMVTDNNILWEISI